MPRPKQAPKTCQIEGCESHVLARGRCSKHYTSAVKSGEIVRKPLKVVNAGPCPVDGCGKPKYGGGFCQAHYERFRKYGDPLGAAPKKTGGPCSTDECSGIVIAHGVCAACYMRIKKRGTLEYSDRHQRRAEKVIDSNGYVRIPVPVADGKRIKRVLEHRHVMAQFLGRPIRASENVHHKNGDKTDNDLGNLELWVTCQPSGQRPLDLIKWAREILKTYAPEEPKLKKLNYRNHRQ